MKKYEKGFKLKIGGKEYFVRVMWANSTGTKNRDYSINVHLQVQVFEENKLINLDKNTYLAEKITDFISNSINGQDTCYWDYNEPNRHFKEVVE